MNKNLKIIALKDDPIFFSKFAKGHVLEIDEELTQLCDWKDAVTAKNLTEPQRTERFPAILFFDEFEFLDDDPDAAEQILRREGL